jgi:hypothetical protein
MVEFAVLQFWLYAVTRVRVGETLQEQMVNAVDLEDEYLAWKLCLVQVRATRPESER